MPRKYIHYVYFILQLGGFLLISTLHYVYSIIMWKYYEFLLSKSLKPNTLHIAIVGTLKEKYIICVLEKKNWKKNYMFSLRKNKYQNKNKKYEQKPKKRNEIVKNQTKCESIILNFHCKKIEFIGSCSAFSKNESNRSILTPSRHGHRFIRTRRSDFGRPESMIQWPDVNGSTWTGLF